ncbi:MAG: hypothetical protein V1776_01600 [Candidatus Diapherotrites archaeon]
MSKWKYCGGKKVGNPWKVPGFLGLIILVVAFAGIVYSQFGGPSEFGHDLSEIDADGELFGDLMDTTTFPGMAHIKGAVRIGTNPIGTEELVVDGAINATGNIGTTGNIDAVGDVCTDAAGGQCLSEVNHTVYLAGGVISKVCKGDCLYHSLGLETLPLEVYCPDNYIPLSCGGGVKMPPGSPTAVPPGSTGTGNEWILKGFFSTPKYVAAGDSTFNGCQLDFLGKKINSGEEGVPSDTLFSLRAYCVRVNP